MLERYALFQEAVLCDTHILGTVLVLEVPHEVRVRPLVGDPRQPDRHRVDLGVGLPRLCSGHFSETFTDVGLLLIP